MMKRQLRYYFNYIDRCNMCGDSTAGHKILGKRLNTSQGKNPSKKNGITTTIVKCSNCGLIYSNPQPVPFDIQDHYGVLPEEYWNEDYIKITEGHFQHEIMRLNSLIEYKKGMKALDIGAGLGFDMIALENAGFDTYGIEPSKQFYERAISKMGIHSQKIKLGQIEEVEFAQNEFDFVSFGAVLEHLYDPSDSILKALNWLKPQGIIHIIVPSSNWLTNKLINVFYRMNGSDYVGNISPMHTPYHLYEFGLKSFQEHSKKNNYEIAFYEYFVCKTYMPKIADFFLIPYMKWTNKGMQLSVWLRKKV